MVPLGTIHGQKLAFICTREPPRSSIPTRRCRLVDHRRVGICDELAHRRAGIDEPAHRCRLVGASHPVTQPPSHLARLSMPARSTSRHRPVGIDGRLVDAGSSMPASHHPPAFCRGRHASRRPLFPYLMSKNRAWDCGCKCEVSQLRWSVAGKLHISSHCLMFIFEFEVLES